MYFFATGEMEGVVIIVFLFDFIIRSSYVTKSINKSSKLISSPFSSITKILDPSMSKHTPKWLLDAFTISATFLIELTLGNGDVLLCAKKEGKFHGKGTLIYKNGDKASCTYDSGEKKKETLHPKEGDIKLREYNFEEKEKVRVIDEYKNGDSYCYTLINGKKEGTGERTFKEGNIQAILCKYKNDEMVGPAKVLFRNGRVTFCRNENGEKTQQEIDQDQVIRSQVDGKEVEAWEVIDMLGMMQQLGAIPFGD